MKHVPWKKTGKKKKRFPAALEHYAVVNWWICASLTTYQSVCWVVTLRMNYLSHSAFHSWYMPGMWMQKFTSVEKSRHPGFLLMYQMICVLNSARTSIILSNIWCAIFIPFQCCAWSHPLYSVLFMYIVVKCYAMALYPSLVLFPQCKFSIFGSHNTRVYADIHMYAVCQVQDVCDVILF